MVVVVKRVGSTFLREHRRDAVPAVVVNDHGRLPLRWVVRRRSVSGDGTWLLSPTLIAFTP
jgi:hypothetical protein